ncbi:MAG: ATP-grasp domain-containing protein [Ardenticatenaceae bacterium]
MRSKIRNPKSGACQSGRVRIGLLERRHPPGHEGAVVDRLVPLLRRGGAQVEVVHAEEGLHRLDVAPPWEVVVLKSGSAAALRLAAAAEGWGIPSVNSSDGTRLAQDKLASTTILQRAGLPIAPARLAWLGRGDDQQMLRCADASLRRCFAQHDREEAWCALAERPLIVKAARGSQGAGLWKVERGEFPALVETLSEGPYLLMDYIPHAGDDLKVFVAGSWLAAIERPFPATTYEAKRGRPVQAPPEVVEVARAVSRYLGLTCFGCDFVRAPDGWKLVDVNAFPGYKGAHGAAEAIAAEIARVARGDGE